MIIPPDPYQYEGAIIDVPIPYTSDKFTYDGVSHAPDWKDFNSVFVSISGVTSATTAGTYNAKFTLNNKRYFRWTDGTTDDKVVPWKIEKADNVIDINPTEMSLTYYDREKTANVSYYGDGELSYILNNDYLTVTLDKQNKTLTAHAQKTGESKITVNVLDGTNYLGGRGEIDVTIDMTQIFSVKTSVDPPLSGYTQGDTTVREGTQVTVTATPNDGYKFVAWKKDGVIVSTNTSYTFIPTSNVELVATLAAIPVYTVTVVVNPDGGGTVTGSGEYREGTQAILNRTIADGYKFSGWFNGSVLLSTDSVYAFNVTSNVTITAKFIEIPVYSIVVSADPESGGTASGSGKYREGTTVTLEYTMADGYRFTGWKNVLTGEIVSTANPYTFTATEDFTIIAKFEEIPIYTVTATIDPADSGTVEGEGNYRYGTTVTIKANPANGYKFTGWKDNGTVVSTSVNYTFNITRNMNFTAAFEVDVVNLGWKTSTLPVAASTNGIDVCYGANRFLAVPLDASTKKMMVSYDGITWTQPTFTGSSEYFAGCVYGNGYYVIVGQTTVWYSSTGTSWTTSSSALANVSKKGLSYGNGVLVSPSSRYTYIYYTTASNGNSGWTYFSPPNGKSIAPAYGNGRFALLPISGSSGAYWIYGSDPVSVTLPVSASWSQVIYGGGKFVAVAKETDDAIYSTDGITWRTTKLPSSANWVSVAYGGEKYVAIAANSNKVAYSKDGVNWNFTNDTLPSELNWSKIIYGGNKFVALACSTTTMAYAIV